MKKGDFAWSTLAKLILALLILLFLVILYFSLKTQIYEVFESIINILRLR